MEDGTKVNVQLWDTAGRKKFKAMTVVNYRNTVGAIIVYDITKIETFDHVQQWLDSLNNKAKQLLFIMLVGNKLDLVEEDPSKRKVPQERARKLCEMHENIKFIETSSFSESTVNEAFETLIYEIYILQQKISGKHVERQEEKQQQTVQHSEEHKVIQVATVQGEANDNVALIDNEVSESQNDVAVIPTADHVEGSLKTAVSDTDQSNDKVTLHQEVSETIDEHQKEIVNTT